MKKNTLCRFAIITSLSLFILNGNSEEKTAPSSTWFRGNTHSHTLESDGDAAPDVVAKWYHDRNYNFLVITDHNKFIEPAKVKLPENKREDFILIPGVEITGAKTIHTTAMNINKVTGWKFDDLEKSKIIQFHVDEAIKAGGQAIVNHPNFHYAISAKDMLPVRKLYMFELFNGHPSVNNNGDKAHDSTEKIWDALLTGGMKMYAVAADDAHHYNEISFKKANPGRGWVMVYAEKLDGNSITKAMVEGNFYTSTGVFLKTCEKGTDTYSVEVDKDKTKIEIDSLESINGEKSKAQSEGVRIDFIGPKGEILHTENSEKGSFKFNSAIPYVRAKVTFTYKKSSEKSFKEYYAWGQPIFTDSRKKMSAEE